MAWFRVPEREESMGEKENSHYKDLTATDFAEILGVQPDELPRECWQAISNADFRYEDVLGEERDTCIQKAIEILDAELPVAGPGEIERWEKGWKEVLDSFRSSGASLDKLTPQYFKYHLLRLRGNYIRAHGVKFEEAFYTVVRYYLFKRYLKDAPAIMEFGCGIGTSLLMLSELYPDKILIGCDWATASQEILHELSARGGKRIRGINFNMFAPDGGVPFAAGSAVLTLAAMEQLGGKFEPFLEYLLANSPSVCVHLEPLLELYDPARLFDYLAVRYHRKRNYLEGFLPRLEQLEQDGRVEILLCRRLYFGSFFNEGYSLVVWKPVH